MKKRLRLSIRLMILAFIFLNIITCHAVSNRGLGNNMPCAIDLKQGNLNVKAASAVTLDGENNVILYSKSSNKKIYPASSGKVLTAITALENSNLNDVVTVSQNALKGQENGGSHIALKKGEKISMEDALHGLLLASGNDCAIAIAEHVSGSEKKFAVLMNKTAKKIGCKNTHFITSSGLFDKNHYTTAYDLALITSYGLKNPDFKQILSQIKYTIKPTNKHKKKVVLYNNHKMTRYKYRYYPGIIGGKRGYITESRFNLITAACRKKLTLITVVCRGDSLIENCEDTKKMLDFFFKSHKVYKYKPKFKQLLKSDDTIIKYSKPEKKSANLVVPVKAHLTNENIKTSFTKYSNLSYPVEKLSKIGEITLSYRGVILGKIAVIAEKKIESPEVTALKTGILGLTLLLILIPTALITGHFKIKKSGYPKAVQKKRIKR